MTRPQLEDGYTRIANELLEAMALTNLSSYEFRILLFIIRKTYGWKKKTDWIALSQISKGTNILKPNVSRTLKKLEHRHMLVRLDHRRIGLQKDYDKWK
jgi:phage replication O-like protein O